MRRGIQRNFVEYHKSIAAELKVAQDRVRNHIGDAHWGEEGRYKEIVLRKILNDHLPEPCRVGTGFICYPVDPTNQERNTSTQIDILITDRIRPTLFKEGDFVITTPDAVRCIVEVKTGLSLRCLRETLRNVRTVRRRNGVGIYRERRCQAGLFVFNQGRLNPEDILNCLKEASAESLERAINYVAIGSNIFVRFWKRGSEVESPVVGPVWHSYFLKQLAPAYFINNVVWDVQPFSSYNAQYAWFPVEGGKEMRRGYYVSLTGDVQAF